MKLTLKLPLAFATAMLVLLCAALYGIYNLNQATHTYGTTLQTSQQNAATASDLLADFKTQVQEWKNTLLRGKDAATLERHWGAFNRIETEMRPTLQDLAARLPAGEARTLVEQFTQAHATMGTNYRRAFESFKAADFDPTVGDKAVSGMDREPAKLLDQAAARIAADGVAAASLATAQAQRATWLSLALMLVVCAVAVVAGIAFSRSITRPIAEAVVVAKAVADGDLSMKVKVRGKDEVAELLHALGAMQANLSRVVAEVRHNADSVASASSQIAQGNQDLSERTEQQASALQETAASMEQLGTTVRQNADNAGQANRLAQSATTVALRGGDVVGQVVNTMKGINDSSQQIADIIGVIDGIAFQTNILALNAAVEAARAGEQGRGFAVVASEVRSLAVRSAAAAKEIKTLIDASVERVGQGTTLVDEAGSTMTEIVASIQRVTDIMGEISSASSQQSSGVSQVGDAVSQMDQATQQNAALVEESAAAAASLKTQSRQLVEAVAVFRLG